MHAIDLHTINMNGIIIACIIYEENITGFRSDLRSFINFRKS